MKTNGQIKNKILSTQQINILLTLNTFISEHILKITFVISILLFALKEYEKKTKIDHFVIDI